MGHNPGVLVAGLALVRRLLLLLLLLLLGQIVLPVKLWPLRVHDVQVSSDLRLAVCGKWWGAHVAGRGPRVTFRWVLGRIADLGF